MKIFCSKCGQPKEVEESSSGAIVTCAHCGNRFGVGGQAPASSRMSTAVIIAVVAVVAVPVVIAIIGILAAIAIPNFIRFQARSKQSECRTNLKALAIAERAYFEAHQQYTPVLAEAGFAPERGNRYAYFAGPGTQEDRTQAVSKRDPGDTQVGVDLFRFGAIPAVTERDVPTQLAGGVHPGASETGFVAACAGSIDNDATLDVWSVSSAERTGPHGELIPAMTPFNDVNDVTE